MKSITISMDDETYRRAGDAAAARDSSVPAMVREFLQTLGGSNDRADQLKRQERALREQITRFRASDRLTRDELHDRSA